MDDPNLPPFARAWAYIGADAMNEWVERVEDGRAIDPVEDLARALLVIVEEQAKVIAQMSLRIDQLADG